MKKYFTLFALMLTALFSNINASAQDALTYITDVRHLYHSKVEDSGYKFINKNLNDGISGAWLSMIEYKTTTNFLSENLISDIIAVRNYSEETISYNGKTYTIIGSGYADNINADLKYNDQDAPAIYLYVAKTTGAIGEKVLTGIEVEIYDEAHSGDYMMVVERKDDGSFSAFGDNNLKKDTGGKFAYLKPTYTTIGYEAYPGKYKENCTEGSGTEDDPYLLSTAGHLYWFSYMVATGNEYICGKLKKDITVNEGVLNEDGSLGDTQNLKPWFPIGYKSDHAFRGMLMGDGHTVSGLYYNDSETDIFTGLVGYGVAVTISRIGVTDSYIAGRKYVGGIAGEVVMKNTDNKSTIKECFFQGTLSATYYGGGIAGRCGNGTLISNCYASVLPLNKTDKNVTYGGILGDLRYGTQKKCYYDGDVFGSTASSVDIIAMTSAEFASGEVASLLNGQLETGEETFRQKIGTDNYPKFKDDSNNNYVFHTSDGGYTNSCTHPSRKMYASKASTCVNEGHIAYFFCDHPACKAYYVKTPDFVTITPNEVVLFRVGDTKPKVIAEQSNVKWEYKKSTTANNKTYYNAMVLSWEDERASTGTYKCLYPIPCGQNKLELNYRIDMTTVGHLSHTATMKVFVNKVERTELEKSVEAYTANEGTLVIDGVAGNKDVVEIEITVSIPLASGIGISKVYLGLSQPVEEESAGHTLAYVEEDDCLQDGLLAHMQCTKCEALFPVPENPDEPGDTYTKSDDMAVTSEAIFRPAYDSHNFEGELTLYTNGLYSKLCTRCHNINKEEWVAKEAIGGEDLHLTGNDTEGFSTDEEISLAYGMDYTVPVPFTAPSVDYTVPVYAKGWSSWSVPFEVTTNQLAEEGFDAAYIEGIHRYDTDDDGTIDRTTLEVIRITNGTLRAGTPYLIRPQGDKTSLTLTIDGAALHKAGELHPINTATALAAYDFVPTYVTVPAEEAEGNYYIIGAENKLGPTSSYVCALDWYLKITDKGSPFDALQGAQSIAIRTVGEQDETTGIFTPYAPDEQTEEIYDLSGRRLDTIPAQGLYIQGNKVKMGK